MRVGIKILDETRYRTILDAGFEQLGYALANSDVDTKLYRAHYSHLTPRGPGSAYLLKFTRAPDRQWNGVKLIAAATNEELAQCCLEDVPNDQEPNAAWAHQVVAVCAKVILQKQQLL